MATFSPTSLLSFLAYGFPGESPSGIVFAHRPQSPMVQLANRGMSIRRPSEIISPQLESAVEEFCRERGILADLPNAIALVQSHFDLGAPVALSRQEDPEGGDTWLEIAADAKGSVSELSESHQRFLRQFRTSMPARVFASVRLYLTSADD